MSTELLPSGAGVSASLRRRQLLPTRRHRGSGAAKSLYRRWGIPLL